MREALIAGQKSLSVECVTRVKEFERKGGAQ